MNRHIDTDQLEVYEGTLPLPVREAAEEVIAAAFQRASDRLAEEGLGPVTGDVAPWEVETLAQIGELLLRCAARNARGLQEPDPVEIVYFHRVHGHGVTGADPVEWQADFARMVEDSDILSAAAIRNGEKLGEYETTRPTAAERIRAARQTATVALYDMEEGASLSVSVGAWVVLDPTGRDLPDCFVVGKVARVDSEGFAIVHTNDGQRIATERVAAVLTA